MTAETEGFNLHAGVRVAACRRRQLERLCSYILRPPVNQERLDFACPHCSGRMRIIAAITQTTVIRAILRACGLPAGPPARAHLASDTCRQTEPTWDAP